MTSSRCAATASAAAPSAASSAAARWCARLPLGGRHAVRARPAPTSGCAKASRGSGRDQLGRGQLGRAAARGLGGSSPASAATCRSAAPARGRPAPGRRRRPPAAGAAAGAGRTRRRSPGARSRTAADAGAVGVDPGLAAASRAARPSSSGLPRARLVAGGDERVVAGSPKTPRGSPPRPPADSGAGPQHGVTGSSRTASSSSAPSLPGSGGRVVSTSSDRQVLDPPGEVVQRPQRRLVGPVGVVDGEQQRAALGQRGDQPVDAVQRGERRATRRLRPGPSTGPASRGGPVQQRRRSSAAAPQHRLEQPAHDPEAELALQRAGPRGQHPEPALGGGRAGRRRSSRVLPIPAGPSTTSAPPRPAAAASSGRRDRGQLVLPAPAAGGAGAPCGSWAPKR